MESKQIQSNSWIKQFLINKQLKKRVSKHQMKWQIIKDSLNNHLLYINLILIPLLHKKIPSNLNLLLLWFPIFSNLLLHTVRTLINLQLFPYPNQKENLKVQSLISFRHLSSQSLQQVLPLKKIKINLVE